VSYSPPYRPFSKENAREDWETFLARAKAAGVERPRWVWVGLGAPKQEKWMEAVAEIAPDTLFFGVGAAFDFLAGTKARAPEWMRKSGLEWLHRFGSEPGRLWKRYLVTHSLFLYELLKRAGRR
jgi:N-acetylglucosaminyldiphosphoundecaprenol N-acetyl-beta-D-mannosaminyltransferase